jgi:hypothetical protein
VEGVDSWGGGEREVQKTREEKLTFYDLHNLHRACYKAYLSVLEEQRKCCSEYIYEYSTWCVGVLSKGEASPL